MQTTETAGQVFREAWIEGVKRHYPGEPKASYIAPWADTPDWERAAAAAVYEQVRAFIAATDGKAAKLTRAQKGRFVALCWIGQIYRHFADPKPAYVADWDEMPVWQQETDADIFERIEQVVRQGDA
jgi:ribosomal protein S12 methylthiotransferase accessory factor YcaO